MLCNMKTFKRRHRTFTGSRAVGMSKERRAFVVVYGPSQQHVFLDRQFVTQLGDLERAVDTQPRDQARRKPGNISTAKVYLTGIRLDIPGYHVDKCRLSGPVRPYQGINRPFGHGNRDIFCSRHSAERFLDVANLKNTSAHVLPPFLRLSSEPKPFGKVTMTINRKIPSDSCHVLGKYRLENERTTSRMIAATNTAGTDI